MGTIYLKNIFDKQQVSLMKLAYLDIDIEKYEELKFAGNEITVSDLSNLLIDPKNSYLGLTQQQISSCLRNVKIDTQEEVIEELKESGLGNLKVRDIASDSNINFKAIALEDDYKNIGMTFSGTDFKALATDGNPHMDTQLVENKEQIDAAQIFFKTNKSQENSNYLYGHSLGGNLATNVYLENFDDVDNTCVINALPVKKEKAKEGNFLKALNDREKYDNLVISGDYTSQLEDESDYWFNITCVENNDKLKNNILTSHLLESATYEMNEDFKCEPYYKYKYKPYKKVEEIDSQEEYHEPVWPNKFLDKVYELSMRIASKFKSLVMRILKQNPKELPSGTEPKKDDVGQARKDFVSQHQLESYIEEGKYTKEQAERAHEISDNPLKFINEEEKSNDVKKEISNDNIIE